MNFGLDAFLFQALGQTVPALVADNIKMPYVFGPVRDGWSYDLCEF